MPTLKMPEVKGTGQPTVLRWRKAVGEAVKKGEVLLLAETDDHVFEVESAADGTLQEVLSPAGKKVPSQTPLAVLECGASAPLSRASEVAKPLADVRGPVAPGGAVIPVVMPKAGQSMEEGMIVKWSVEPGTRIKKGQVIFVVETDKATVDVEAVDEGRLARIIVPQGETVPVQAPVAYLAEQDADVDSFLAQAGGAPVAPASEDPRAPSRAVVEAPAPVAPAVVEGGRVRASPAARKLAEERGINLAALGAGSGPGGRILSTDVAAGGSAGVSALPHTCGIGVTATEGGATAAPAPAGGVRKKMSQMRKAIARNLLWSKQNIPHFYLKLTVNAEPMFAFYKQEKTKYPCSVNDVALAAVAKAVSEFTQFRCRMENGEMIEYPTANIGVAVGLDEGLAVPVLVEAEKLSLQQIGAEAKRLAEAARKGKVEHMGEGVFTVTNLGMFGIEEFIPIINPPEAAILAVGAATDRLVFKDGAARQGKVMTMVLSVDHRVIDGMAGSKFLARLKELLEDPGKLL